MKQQKLPEKERYTLKEAAERWSCGVQDVIHYATLGEFRLHTMAYGWYLKCMENITAEHNETICFSEPVGLLEQDVKVFERYNKVNVKFFMVNGSTYGLVGASFDTGLLLLLEDLFITKEELKRFETKYLHSDALANSENEAQALLDNIQSSGSDLGVAVAAFKHFWYKHDPQRPPKSKDICDWIGENYDLTHSAAKEIDRRIRPKEYREGGNMKNPGKQRVLTP